MAVNPILVTYVYTHNTCYTENTVYAVTSGPSDNRLHETFRNVILFAILNRDRIYRQ